MYPYKYMQTFQDESRLNHTGDVVPWVPNIIVGFDARPTEEVACIFAEPTAEEWVAELETAKQLVLSPANAKFGFPDGLGGVVPALSIYAWNEYAEGGILAPTRGSGYTKLQAILDVFGPEAQGTPPMDQSAAVYNTSLLRPTA